jgi:L-2-hydroxyglutarate oxidase
MRFCIVGGGIIGLALARLIAREERDAAVIVLEKEAEPATHQTGHNSGVVHAGLYYEPGSLKARLCRRGADLLRAYCEEHALPYSECGKLVVASEERELVTLERLHSRAVANGVPDLAMLDAAGLRAVEPHAIGVAALHSPRTAIVDYRRIAARLGDEVRAAGGEVRTDVTVERVRHEAGRAVVELADGSSLAADQVVVCAGLQTDRLAVASGQSPNPRIVAFRGEYWALRPERQSLVRGLVYPVPDPSLPFLGVHLTRRIDGAVLIGPSALLALAREGYDRRQVNVTDLLDALRWPGTWRMMRKHWRTGVTEVARAARRDLFVSAARQYVPDLCKEDVVRAPAGVRAQAIDRDGTLIDDFRLQLSGRVAWVRNAPSPAATSSLAIAEELLERMRLGRPTAPTPSKTE